MSESLGGCDGGRQAWEQYRRPLAVAAAVVWVIILGVILVRITKRPEKNSVYRVFSEAGEKWRAGQNVYLDVKGHVGTYRYSPAVAAVFSLVDWLPDPMGSWLWLAINVGIFFGGFAWWCRRALPNEPGRTPFVGLLLLVATPMLVGSFNNLQANPFVIGAFLGATAAVREKRFTVAAILIVLATALKVYPLALGLVFVVLYPGKMGWRLAVGLAVAAVFPFLFQGTDYVVESYKQWKYSLTTDVRYEIALKDAYRDAALLWRAWVGLDRLNVHVYMAVQALGAVAVGALALWLRGWRPARGEGEGSAGLTEASQDRQKEALRLHLLLGAVIAWILILGPSTESSTYILLGPMAAWIVLTSAIERWPRGWQVAAWAGYGLALLGAIAVWFPAGPYIQGRGPQPAGAILLFAAFFGGTALEFRKRSGDRLHTPK